MRRTLSALAICALLPSLGCDTPDTNVVLDNDYPTGGGQILFRGRWLTTSFMTPIPPGTSSDPESTPSASPNTAYALIAPGWDPASGGAPTSLVVLQSMMGFEVHLNQTLHIPVDDMTFAGNCATGSSLSQEQADFITQQVFADEFSGQRYDAATCTTSSAP
jgi:hypothetical protein